MFLIGVINYVDDEYRWVGVEDFKIMIIIFRDFSLRFKMFVKVLVAGSEWEMFRCSWF